MVVINVLKNRNDFFNLTSVICLLVHVYFLEVTCLFLYLMINREYIFKKPKMFHCLAKNVILMSSVKLIYYLLLSDSHLYIDNI